MIRKFFFALLTLLSTFKVHSSVKTKLSAEDYIELLSLERHVEGGCFSLYYRANDSVMPLDSRYQSQERCAGSSIYFLLDKQDFSAWHRLKSDEIWHYYDGDSCIDMHVIDENGVLTRNVLGNPGMIKNASFQVVIKAGCWFAAELQDKSSFALVGCTVSPGFEYEDFELGNRVTLSNQHPEHASIISRMTR